mmetsp:Transcript_36138/g.115717  ORF Transcript_36138/g.115717 Transcript_36138/m.115717 type:complete len:111 (-) Transcript_36138:32-364(-)
MMEAIPTTTTTKRMLVLVAVLASQCLAARINVPTTVPTSAPSPVGDGPLEPCVKRLEVHKAIMAKTLLTVAILSFFLGVCLCSFVVCCLWCISAKVSYNADGGLERREKV